MDDKVVVTCAMNGVLTDPEKYPVPYTPEEMADEAKRAYDAGASVVHIHIREQNSGRFPSWDPDLTQEIVDAIKAEAPDIVINLTTGIPDDSDEVIAAPLNYLEEVDCDMAAMNSGSLNYLGIRSNGEWKWPPMLFKNPVEKVKKFLDTMYDNDIIPECECFDTGILRSLNLYEQNGFLERPFTVSLIQGVESGMPAREDLLPILVDEMPDDVHWQSILIGRDEIWDIHRKTAEMGGHLRTGVEDTFYLPDGEKVDGNGPLIEEIVDLAREVGREPATPDEAREMIGAEG
ncbi:MAG: 3-keto-5-aminohexanoate cleavage protein [Bradymonadaceae bacterium]